MSMLLSRRGILSAAALAALAGAGVPLVSSPAAAAAGDDLYYIKTSGTGQGMVEVHALSGASGYQEFTRHTVTVLAEGERDNGTFQMVGEDLYYIKTSATGQGMV